MADFMFIYRGGNDQEAEMSPEQMQQYMEQWITWIQDSIKAGWMVSPGDALRPEGRLVKQDGELVITDGPFPESKEIVGGYSLIRAENLDEAAQLAAGCPGFQTGGCVEVRPLAQVPTE